MKQININVHQVTRVEGHGNIVLNATDGRIKELRWEVPESPRFFEAMLRGRYYEDVPYIASRICGICSIAHSTASIQATEAAFGIQPSEQTLLLRKLLFDAEILESHVLHAYFLVVPDFLGVGSVFPLLGTHPEAVVRAVRLKKLAYKLAELLAGRQTHPLSCVVGGFARLPDVAGPGDQEPRQREMGLEIEHPGLLRNQERFFLENGAPDLPLESGKRCSEQIVRPDLPKGLWQRRA